MSSKTLEHASTGISAHHGGGKRLSRSFLPRHTGEVPRRGGGGKPQQSRLQISDHCSSRITCVAFPLPALPRMTGEEKRGQPNIRARIASLSKPLSPITTSRP